MQRGFASFLGFLLLAGCGGSGGGGGISGSGSSGPGPQPHDITTVSPVSGSNHTATLGIAIDADTALTGATAVTLGDPANTSFSGGPPFSLSNGDTRITGLSLPSGVQPGTYAVKVTDANGKQNTVSTATYTVLDGKPVIQGVTAAGGVAMGRATDDVTITITGQNFTGVGPTGVGLVLKSNTGTVVPLSSASANLTGTSLTALVGKNTATVGTYLVRVQNAAWNGTVTGTIEYDVVVNTHLLITEVQVGDDNEFVEIYNPTLRTIDLSNYYLTDGTDNTKTPAKQYWKITDATVNRADATNNHASDFHVQFPSGKTIAAGAYVVIAIQDQPDTSGATSQFLDAFGRNPDYELSTDTDTIPNMVTAIGQSLTTGAPGSNASSRASLTNGGEVVVLYKWDGTSNLVQDVDSFLWGGSAERTQYGTARTTTDPGWPTTGTPPTYLADTLIANQKSPSGGPTTNSSKANYSYQRRDYTEAAVGTVNLGTAGTPEGITGNGITLHDETSEDTTITFTTAAFASPGAGIPVYPWPGQTNVPIGTATNPTLVQIVFPLEMDPTSFTGAFTLTDGTTPVTGVPPNGTLDAATKKIFTFTPNAALAVGTYTVTLTTAIQYVPPGGGTAGFLSANLTWQFKTAP